VAVAKPSKRRCSNNWQMQTYQGLDYAQNQKFILDRPLTEESEAATYNNFYEFSSGKEVWRNVGSFNPYPWSVEISGLVNNPQTLAIEDLLAKMPLEERLYRHRCVEAWAMAVPWIGFPMQAKLLNRSILNQMLNMLNFQLSIAPRKHRCKLRVSLALH
jgi:sulfoxide reductase catalytic subunit YedY